MARLQLLSEMRIGTDVRKSQAAEDAAFAKVGQDIR